MFALALLWFRVFRCFVQRSRYVALLPRTAAHFPTICRLSSILWSAARKYFYRFSRRRTTTCSVYPAAVTPAGLGTHLCGFSWQCRQHWPSPSERSAAIQLLSCKCSAGWVSRLRQKLWSAVGTRFDQCYPFLMKLMFVWRSVLVIWESLLI